MTIKEIAGLAGVSIATVSKIVNGKDQNINPATRDKVLRIVKEYNYTPYSSIKNISTAKTFLIGVLLSNASHCSDLISGIVGEAQNHGYGILLFDSCQNPETELKHITSLIKNRVDGMIWEPVNSDSSRRENYFSEAGIPVVFVNTPSQSGSFLIDYEQIGFLMTEKLLQYKHSRIACLRHPGISCSCQIIEGFKKCLFENQITYTPEMNLDITDQKYIEKIVIHNITGVVSTGFRNALQLYERIDTLRYGVPSDLSIVTLKESSDQNSLNYPGISGITAPFHELGSRACQYLIDKCEKRETTPVSPLLDSHYSFDHEKSVTVPPSLRSKKIIVIGSINIDSTFNVDALPQSGETTKIINSTVTLGGKGANQSIGAARLGREVSLIGKVGNDADSFLIIDTLKKERVSTSGIDHDKNAQTGKAFIYLENDGESAITILSGANGTITPSDVDKREYLFRNAGYALLSTELPVSVITEAARLSRENGCKNILKPSALKEIPKELSDYTDILIPNKKEADTLCPGLTSVEEQAEYFIRLGISAVIITLGHKGCFLHTGDTMRYYPAADFTPIDTTGGADAFISALASYLITGFSLENAIQIATYAAGFCISRQGVVPSLVDKNTLETHIRLFDSSLLKK